MSWFVSPWVYPVWDSSHFLNLIDYFLSHAGKVSIVILSKNFSDPFFIFFSWDLYNLNVDAFNIVPEVSETILNLLILFLLFSSSVVISTILYSSSLFCSSASLILLLITFRIFLISIMCCSFLFVYSLGPC